MREENWHWRDRCSPSTRLSLHTPEAGRSCSEKESRNTLDSYPARFLLVLRLGFWSIFWQWARQTPSDRLIGSSTARSSWHITHHRERERPPRRRKRREMREVIRSRCRFEQWSTRCDKEWGRNCFWPHWLCSSKTPRRIQRNESSCNYVLLSSSSSHIIPRARETHR